MSSSAFVKLEGEFRVDDPNANVQEFRRIIKESLQVQEFTTHQIDLDPSTTDYPINFGGLTAGQVRKLLIQTNTEVTVKINGTTGPSFQMLSTTILGGRIDSLHISTTLDPACITVAVAGL